MFVNIVKFGYFVLFGLLKLYFGQALFGETESDVTLVIKLVNYPVSCNGINIIFHQLQCISSENTVYNGERLMAFTSNGVQCLSIIDANYETRIFNVSVKFPTYVTFVLRNVSLYDSGCYQAMDEDWYFNNGNSSVNFEERKLLVGDTMLKTCTLKQMELEFVLPLSVVNEMVAVVFFSGIRWSEYIISICNPEAGSCVPPPRATFPQFQSRMNGSRITITLTSVQMDDEGIYALIGPTSRITYQSAVLNVIECASDMQSVAASITGSPAGSDSEDSIIGIKKKKKVASDDEGSDDNKVDDKSLENYFLGGGVVAGITIVILICWFLWKRCYGIRGNGASGVVANDVDDHNYCSLRNRNQCVTQSEATPGSVPESHQLSAIMDETTFYENI